MLTVPGATRERVQAAHLDSPAVLAVSGGADSMVMAAVLLERAPAMVTGLATFDHGSGPAAQEAVEMVMAWAAERGVPVLAGHAPPASARRTEASWRATRWQFLRSASATFGAPIATAHTRDDQAETVFMRLLRGSGVRGLAGLLAESPVLRPMLHVARSDVRRYAAAERIPFRHDPSNDDLRHLRNRVRLELLPILERGCPGFGEWLLELGGRAAAWRRDVADAVDQVWAPIVRDEQVVQVPRVASHLPDEDEAALFWPEVAARIGVTLDRRGTARLASFTTKRGTGLSMPLSGGATVRSFRRGWTMERAEASDTAAAPPIGWHHATAD